MAYLSRRTFLKGTGASSLLSILAACGALPRTTSRSPVELPLSGNRRIKLLFHFSSHGSEKDAQTIEPLLASFKPHIVCIENAGSTNSKADALEATFALEKPFFFNRNYGGLHRVFRKYGIRRVHVLERFNEKEADELEQLFYKTGPFRNPDPIGLFLFRQPQAAIDNFRQFLQLMKSGDIKREERVKQALSTLHKDLVAKFPELSSELEVRVVIRYGSAHTPLYKYARQSDFGAVDRRMAKPFYFSPLTTYLRRAAFGLSASEDDEVIAKTLLGEIIFEHAYNLGVNPSNSAAYANLISKQISLEKFHRISNQRAELPVTSFSADSFKAVFEKEKLPFPTSN